MTNLFSRSSNLNWQAMRLGRIISVALLTGVFACSTDDPSLNQDSGDDDSTHTTDTQNEESTSEDESGTGDGGTIVWDCVGGDNPENHDFLKQVGCEADFIGLASEPLDSSIPGAISVKTIYDRSDGELYFQNSKKYKIHWDFAKVHLSGNGKPIVPQLQEFNMIEYYNPNRRFILGSLTYYEGPKAWTWEISPYDTASADMIQTSYEAIADSIYIGDELLFHPTSESVEKVAEDLPESVKTISTETLFDGINYQPLNLGESYGKLRVMKAKDLETEYLGFRDIAVLDAVPNDISVVQGLITAEFQTPLSHVNVLSQNRGTPNMGLRGADKNPEIVALHDKWVRLKVDAFGYELVEVTQQEADDWWEENKPEPLGVPKLDLDTRDLRDCLSMIDPDEPKLKEAVKALIPAFGGKASNYGGLAQVTEVPSPRAYAIPVAYYWDFMETNGFHDRVKEFLADPEFQGNAKVRDETLEKLRDDMKAAPMDPEFMELLTAKIESEYPNTRLRFRSSTNAEDLDGFTGAGLYTSKSGQLGDPTAPIEDAIREVWASVWFFRAFEERSYRSIDHNGVGMAILSHRSFPMEVANGVALTANPFDTTGAEPGFYVNVQKGGESVVMPESGVTTDQFIYHYEFPNQPIVFIAHSSLVPASENVLTTAQTYELGKALSAIHKYFAKAYKPPGNGWYAMDVEFKFDEPLAGGPVQLFVKQARPHPGWGD